MFFFGYGCCFFFVVVNYPCYVIVIGIGIVIVIVFVIVTVFVMNKSPDQLMR